MKYRSDIDGLRAIAVLSVIAFHYNFGKWAPGGYVGVDIFFVISGFLITRIIFDGIGQRTYRIADFYERRVRRIFPALFVMFGGCLIASCVLGLQAEIADTGRSIAGSIFFVSNILFYFSSGYFDDGLVRNPVLHTWSLSVEEQFYVLFPIFIFAIRNFSRQYQKWMLVSVTLISFVASIWRVNVEPNGAFYLVQFRAWELLTGGLVAIGIFPAIKRRLAIEAIALAGLAAILASLRLYSKTTPFPGFAAALPCFGAAAIIYAGGCGTTQVSKLLSLPPARFIGLISYSLYLWHWPLVAYYTNFRSLEGFARFGLLAAAIVIATASWRFVEQPFRQKTHRLGQRATLGGAVATMVLLTGIALSLGPVGAKYWPDTEIVQKLAAFENYDNVAAMRTGTCLLTPRIRSLNPECLKLSADKMNVLVLGDSHAAHLWAGYQTTFPNINFLQATAAGCKPIITEESHERCKDLMHYIFDKFLPANHVDLIIMSGRWFPKDVAEVVAVAGNLRRYATRIVISGPVQEYDLALPFLLAHAANNGEDFTQVTSQHLQPMQKITDKIFSSIALPDGVTYVSVYKAMCTPNCRLTVGDDIPVQFDYGHLTKDGAIYLAQKIGPQVLGIAN
jgi:peptidoglycan/LPS O-acetylase OafA/YrhL